MLFILPIFGFYNLLIAEFLYGERCVYAAAQGKSQSQQCTCCQIDHISGSQSGDDAAAEYGAYVDCKCSCDNGFRQGNVIAANLNRYCRAQCRRCGCEKVDLIHAAFCDSQRIRTGCHVGHRHRIRKRNL